jgi:hypothetical protein
MKQIKMRWAIMVAGLVLLLCLALPPIPPAKARATRVSGVNNLAQPFPKRNLEVSVVAPTNIPVSPR